MEQKMNEGKWYVFFVFSVCLKYDIKQIPRLKKYSNFPSQGDEIMHDFVLPFAYFS